MSKERFNKIVKNPSKLEKKDLQLLEQDGHTKEQILKIITLIKKAEFKRKQAPPILKLSSQSLGNDWRIPIAIFD